ncbi:hypothetical protein [Alkalibacillus aidingensis]|uniref:hypothetical protein n=1 Tax=Alkalibacillus aidingensis TaxID=2747607 RepID=UPI001660CA01|nr:hypothetical protein [Alkalibacillus aidingensis]
MRDEIALEYLKNADSKEEAKEMMKKERVFESNERRNNVLVDVIVEQMAKYV